jgi:hypothetical protein
MAYQKRIEEPTHLSCRIGNHHLCDYISYRAGDESNDCVCSCHKKEVK